MLCFSNCYTVSCCHVTVKRTGHAQLLAACAANVCLAICAISCHSLLKRPFHAQFPRTLNSP